MKIVTLAGAIGIGATLMLSALLAPQAFAVDGPNVADDFESSNVSDNLWWVEQTRPYRYWTSNTPSRCGRQSIAIRVKGEDSDCGGLCQRNEIRTANTLRPNFGDEIWYGFSFKIEAANGDIPNTGSSRWIIGQWKEETDGSPFVAQRFDNGVFHITVQDGECRALVAQAEGDFERLRAYTMNFDIAPFGFICETFRYQCKPNIKIELGADPLLPDPRADWVDMVYRIRGGRENGLVEIWANGKQIARVTGAIGHMATAGPTQYFKIGMYRDPLPGTATIYVDAFRQGTKEFVLNWPCH